MKFKRSVLSMVSGVMAALMVSGCNGGTTTNVAITEDPNKVPKDTYEINWYIYGSGKSDVQSVEQAVNEYLKNKINATLKINCLESSQYSQKMSAMMQAGEYFDMAFASSAILDYKVNAENGAFLALDNLVKTYMPKTYAMYDQDVLQNAKIGNVLYGLPVIKENAAEYGWIYRKDIADKYDIDMSKIKSFEDLEPVLELVKKNEPGIEYPVDWKSDLSPSGAILGYEIFGANSLGVYPDNVEEIVNVRADERYLEGAKLARRFYEKGLVKKDVLTTSSEFNQRMKDGKTFCHLSPLKPGKASEQYKNSAYSFDQVTITEKKQTYLAGTSSMTVVSATSKNPARVLRFLELLNTDEYLNNLIIYGVEGKHYDKVSEGMVTVKPNSSYSFAGSQWMIANVFLTYVTADEDPEKNVKLKAFDEGAAKPIYNNFVFVSSSVQAQIAACQALDKQYIKQISLGAVAPEPVWKEYISALEQSGINDVKVEMQKQYDEYLKTKK